MRGHSESHTSDIWRWSAREIAAAVAAKRVSARDVAKDALARLEAVNPAINAVVECRPDEVLAADAIDAALAAGHPAGPLCGVPVTTKINVDQRGFATTNGTRLQREIVAAIDNPVVANLRAAGAVLLGRTNAPAFSYRYFTSNNLYGATKNPRDPALTPGGSSGGAAAALTTGIGALAHGTDVAGSIRYPAYACGIHGLRPSVGRVPAFNAALPENKIGVQMTAVSRVLLARSVGDLRVALAAMAAPSVRDPWYVPAPLVGPDVPRRAKVCLRPDGLATTEPVAAALRDAAARLAQAGWQVEEVENLPPLREPAEMQMILWLGDGFAGMLAAAEREGEPGALALLNGCRAFVAALPPDAVTKALARRATLARQWADFLADTAVVLMPVSAELPFADGLDLVDEAALQRVFAAQMPMLGLPLMGVPALTVSTGFAPSGACVGVQIVAARFREDLCLAAGEVIEAGGAPTAPIEPVG